MPVGLQVLATVGDARRVGLESPPPFLGGWLSRQAPRAVLTGVDHSFRPRSPWALVAESPSNSIASPTRYSEPAMVTNGSSGTSARALTSDSCSVTLAFGFAWWQTSASP